jgi:hypothetical protein
VSQHGDTSVGTYASGDVNVYNRIKSLLSSDIYLKWKVVGKDLPTGWTITGICDNQQCYPGNAALLNGTATHVSNPYTNTFTPVSNPPLYLSSDFHVIFNGDNAVAGSTAWIQVQAVDTENSNYTKVYTFVLNKPISAGVNSVVRGDDVVTIYPNPARSNVNVIFDASMGVKNVAIYNLIGKIVSIYKVNGNSAKLELDEVPAGIYFLRLINGQGKIVGTRKFTHQ